MLASFNAVLKYLYTTEAKKGYSSAGSETKDETDLVLKAAEKEKSINKKSKFLTKGRRKTQLKATTTGVVDRVLEKQYQIKVYLISCWSIEVFKMRCYNYNKKDFHIFLLIILYNSNPSTKMINSMSGRILFSGISVQNEGNEDSVDV